MNESYEGFMMTGIPGAIKVNSNPSEPDTPSDRPQKIPGEVPHPVVNPGSLNGLGDKAMIGVILFYGAQLYKKYHTLAEVTNGDLAWVQTCEQKETPRLTPRGKGESRLRVKEVESIEYYIT